MTPVSTSPTRLAAWAVALALVATAPAEAAVHAPVAKKKKRKRKPLTHVDGDAIGTKYGAVQVRVYFRGRRIVNVRVLQHPDEVERSRQIDANALPKLRAKVLARQSAKIDGVSGATYTSAAYKQSAQSALDLA
jgi:uncharacterized protein with FMN-binding domain